MQISVLFLSMLIGVSVFAKEGDSLVCEILGEGIKRIQCTYFTQRIPEDRNITFLWQSPSIQEDQRERTIVLDSQHGSLYDYRYYYGRAPGAWEVMIKEGDEVLASTKFVIEESEEDKEY
jgi:hypothetical protein